VASADCPRKSLMLSSSIQLKEARWEGRRVMFVLESGASFLCVLQSYSDYINHSTPLNGEHREDLSSKRKVEANRFRKLPIYQNVVVNNQLTGIGKRWRLCL
jgi:hypothetical protein